MKAMKCILSVIPGIVVGLLSACTPRSQPETQPTAKVPATAEDPSPAKEEQPETKPAPDKEQDLPIRRPILE